MQPYSLWVRNVWGQNPPSCVEGICFVVLVFVFGHSSFPIAPSFHIQNVLCLIVGSFHGTIGKVPAECQPIESIPQLMDIGWYQSFVVIINIITPVFWYLCTERGFARSGIDRSHSNSFYFSFFFVLDPFPAHFLQQIFTERCHV